MANIMSRHLQPNKFSYGDISLKKFLSFGFPGVEDLTNMFEYLNKKCLDRDIPGTKLLNKDVLSFNDWIEKNKEFILKSI